MKFSESLKKNRDFQSVYRKGKPYGNKYLVMYLLANDLGRNRVGISVSKKVGNSIIRHHLTRLIRESYRLHEEQFQCGYRKDDRQRPVIPWDWKRSHPSGQTSSHLFGLQLASSVYREDGYTLRGTEIMKKILLYLIRFYRKYLSPMKVYTHCIYIPTCSEYALEAIEKYGAFKGGLLTVWRILRCNPFAKGGYDPVP